MSYPILTPQRPLPGAYVPTPAASKYGAGPVTRQLFPRPVSTVPLQQSTPSTMIAPAQSAGEVTNPATQDTLTPVQRAAKTINDTLTQELRYPELDSYIGQGISSEYDAPAEASWAPFQKTKAYPIPDRIFEQYNRAQVSTMMGLFAELNHAWITIDNALYLWDYTHPDPELVGYEEQSNSIVAVSLVVPRPGVFIPSITRLLVVATTAEIVLVGLSSEVTATNSRTVSLFQTKMSVPTKGLDVRTIVGSAASGRIFFSGSGSNDVYELTYQQEEKWFQNRCAKICHTSTGMSLLPPTLFGSKTQPETVLDMVVDDSRYLLYTLSSSSTIRVFHLRPNNGLNLVITKTLGEILNHVGHMTSQTELISPKTKVVSIHPISAREASKMHLMATTSTGCRLYMSATSMYGTTISDASSNAPTNMQVHHVKFPPADKSIRPAQPQSTALVSQATHTSGINTSSKTLCTTRSSTRYPPGYFFCFVNKDAQSEMEMLFISAPDTARIGRPQDNAMLSRFYELGTSLNLGGRAEAVGLVSAPFSAASSPIGFANELAIQFDRPSAEVAILTHTGVHTLRRRRLVDMFASAIRTGGGEEGLEGEVKKFIRLYGRSETAATALAVACGQGLDVTNDFRVASVQDPAVLEHARTAFIDFGGKPLFNENSVDGQAHPTLEMVRPSPRHEGLALYVSRLVRSFWKSLIAQEVVTPTGGLTVRATVSMQKLQDAQSDLVKLQQFLETNKSFIDGLAGPEALGRVGSKQEEVSLQAEHRALYSLVVLIGNIIEGISFVQLLFAERLEELVLSLSNETRQNVRNLTFEGLFTTSQGRDLAKELVKAIVNRNIANGSNVETVAESLRRRCGSFCSAADVVVFKAQEQLKKAGENSGSTDFSRNLLNESLRLFKEVADSLLFEQLQWAIQQYISMEFYAGAIELALDVARESDRGNRALSWIQEGRPENDARVTVFNARKRCYNLIHEIIVALDQASLKAPTMDGQYDLASRRRTEAYNVIDTSDDEVFQTDLYDWYLSQGQADRLLEIQSPFVVTYLERKSKDDVPHADLLWRYLSQGGRSHEAAAVQLELAKSPLQISLNQRIEYLSRAKANASIYASGIARSNRQKLLREVADLLDIANIQDDLLQRLRSDARLVGDQREEVIRKLDGQIQPLNVLYNEYADQAGYFDICLQVYQAADHRNPTDIRDTWNGLLSSTHQEALEKGTPMPWEAVVDKVRTMGNKLNLSESTFPVTDLVQILERYAYEHQRDVGPPHWVVDLFLDLSVPCETMFGVLEAMLYNDEAPFHGSNRKVIANEMLYVAQKWFYESSRGAGRVFGSDDNAIIIQQSLQMMMQNGLSPDKMEECQTLRMRIDQMLR